jgi:tetratricopeptide (TPR) repeat protein
MNFKLLKYRLYLLIFFITVVQSCSGVSLHSYEDNKLINFDSEWNYSKPAATRLKFNDIYEKENSVANLNYQLELKTQIARTYSLEGSFKEAHATLDEVYVLLSESSNIARIRYHLERGRTHNSANKKVLARTEFNLALKFSKKFKNDFYAIDAIHMLSLAVKSDNLKEKLKLNQEGLKISKNTKDDKSKRWAGVFYNNMGWDYFENKEFSKALSQFKLCRDFYSDRKNFKRRDVARWSMGKAYRLLGELDTALQIINSLLQENNGEDSTGYTFEEMAEIQLKKENLLESKKYFTKAYTVLSKDSWMLKNEKQRLERILRHSL